MEKFETHHDENQENGPVIIGFLGAPGLGKTVAMHVVENEENLKDVKESLGREQDVTVGVARKATSRPSRGADDVLKISGVPEEEFVEHKDDYVGEYTLTNNNAKYAYPKAELEKDADVLVAEPSIWHLGEMKKYLGDRLVITLIAADTNIGKRGGTEGEQKRNLK